MIELIYFSAEENGKKAYQVIQEKPDEPWQIVDGDELIGRMEKMLGFWNLRCWGEIPEGMVSGIARLIEGQHYNQLPVDIKTHWADYVHEVIPRSDAEYLVICKARIDFCRFQKLFGECVAGLIKDEWQIRFRVYDADMSRDFEVFIN